MSATADRQEIERLEARVAELGKVVVECLGALTSARAFLDTEVDRPVKPLGIVHHEIDYAIAAARKVLE